MISARARRGNAGLAALAASLTLVACGDQERRAVDVAKGSAALAPKAARAPEREARKPQPDRRSARFTVSFSGDLLMHQPLLDRALANGGGGRYDFAPFFARLDPYIADADLATCHLETPLAPGTPATYPIFRTPPDLAESIAKTGWDACQTASNHSVDQGASGIRETSRALDRADVAHTGSFPSRQASREPTVVRVRPGLKLGIVAYTDATNGLPLPDPWAVNVYSPDALAAAERKIVHDARRARQAGADAVIVNLHWGVENAADPSSAQRELAKRLTASDSIAAVVGQGPHVVQPIDRSNGKFVVFSEGNLVSNQSPAAGLPAATQDGLIALLHFVARGNRVRAVRLRYLPTWVRPGDYVVLPALRGEDPAREDELAASYRRTVSVAGEGRDFGPIPRD